MKMQEQVVNVLAETYLGKITICTNGLEKSFLPQTQGQWA